MNRFLIGGMLAVAAVLAGQNVTGQPQKVNPNQYGWLTNLEQAKSLAKKTGKPIFLVFRCEP